MKVRPVALGICLLGCFGILAPSPAEAAKKKPKTASVKKGKSAAGTLSSKQAAEAPVVIPSNPGEIKLVAKGAIVIDALTGEEIYGKDADQIFYPASATKVLTALLVIEEGDLDKVVTIEEADTKVEPSAIYFKPGDQHTRRELLYALMLKSANDAAQALARDNAGSIEAFAEKMTRRAYQLGAVNSHFMNPHGLHHPDHYTTPRDLAIISRAAMQLPVFRHFVGTKEWTWHGSQGAIPLRNTNRLLRTMPECTGVKTGYTVKAQHVLVSAAKRDDREVISVVMHSDKPGKWTDSKILLGYGLQNLPRLRSLLDTATSPSAPPAR